METYLKAGVLGVILTFALNFLLSGLGIIPPFLPAFIAVIVITAIFKIDGIKEALIVGFMAYLFSDIFLGALAYVLLYFEYFMEPVQVTIQFSVLSLINLILTPFTAVVAAYLGTYFVKIRSI